METVAGLATFKLCGLSDALGDMSLTGQRGSPRDQKAKTLRSEESSSLTFPVSLRAAQTSGQAPVPDPIISYYIT